MAITIILGAIISAVAYRMGGSDTYNPKWRDWGCSLIPMVVLYHIYGKLTLVNVILYLLTFLLSWGALSTYWKKGADAKAINWFFHGFGIGLSSIPFAWIGIAWWLILLRAVVLGITMMAVSELSDNVYVEECGRGALIVLTLPILFIGGL